METFIAGFGEIFGAFSNIVLLLLGTLLGIVLGAIPGLTGMMGVTLMVPLTFKMGIVPSMCLLLGCYCGGTYGGSVTAILINTPGAAASWCTSFDGYTLAQKGKPGVALRMALYASVFGGLISCIVLIFMSPLVAKFALLFGPAEYLALVVMGLTVVGGVSNEGLCKGLIAAAFGLLVSAIGAEPYYGMPRLTFGNLNLYGGIAELPILIGLFALPEILGNIEKKTVSHKVELPKPIGSQKLAFKEFFSYWKTLIKSALIGCYIGAVPGIGASVATVISYNEAKRASKTPELFGKGHLDGIAAAESGNNGVTGATLIPLLTLGIPGDMVTAIMMSAFTIHGLHPGPLLFTESGSTVYAIFIALILINIAMLVLGKLGMPFFPYLNYIPAELLFPFVFVVAAIGAYAGSSNSFQLLMLAIFGVYGFLAKKIGLPNGAFVIAYLLGDLFEQNLQRTMLLYSGKLYMIFTRPIVLLFVAITVFTVFYIAKNQKRQKQINNENSKE